jgi:hypothetical protein
MQRVITELVDDLDGTKADETVSFTIDGVEYEIDLSKQNAGNLRRSLEEYASKGRRTSGRSKRGPAKGRGVDKSQSKAMREWAQSHGMTVSARGRISEEVAQAFADSHRR